MTHTPDVPELVVARAAAALREHIDPGWIDARDRVRSAALAATRRTWPLALRGAPGLYVSDQVIISLLRQTIDAIDHVTASVAFITPRDDLVDLVTIEITVDYPEPIGPLAGAVRERSLALLRDLLAPRAEGPNPPIDIEVTSVEQT